MKKVSRLLEKILRDVQSLSDEEREQLASMLTRSNGAHAGGDSEQAFEQNLAAEGFLTVPVTSDSGPVPLGPPLPTRGRPLSQILIEERR